MVRGDGAFFHQARLLLVGAAGRTEGAVAQDMGRGAGQRMIGKNINTYRNAEPESIAQ